MLCVLGMVPVSISCRLVDFKLTPLDDSSIWDTIERPGREELDARGYYSPERWRSARLVTYLCRAAVVAALRDGTLH